MRAYFTYPKPYFEILEKPVAQIVERLRPGYFEGVQAARARLKPAPAATATEAVR